VTERPSRQNSDASFQPITDAGSDNAPVKPTSNPFHDDREKWSEENRGILIIEDDESFARTLANKIRARGLKVLIAGNGTDGIGLAYHYRPIGIVLDMGLPDMDGSEVVRALKQYQRTRMIPVHIVSARDVDPELFKLGVTEYIQKPLTSERLNKLLEELETFNETPIGRLLVIEDNETARMALKRVLSKKGIEVSFATNQNQALELVRSEAFDAYIIDLGLPDGDGLQLAKEVAERNPTAPVIIYTGEELSTERYEAVMETNPKVVLKGAHGTKRLLDEVELFVHKLKATTSVAIDKSAPSTLSEDDVLTDKKVLVVDDDMRNAFALTRVLKKMGMRVVLANDGQLALNKLDEQGDIDIVLMDIMMPVMDGYEAMRRIRSHPRYRDVPIIALTAKAMADERKKCIDAGASDYLSKPIDIDKLKTLMKLYLSS
jgi:CheY-like chemotaxis protein